MVSDPVRHGTTKLHPCLDGLIITQGFRGARSLPEPLGCILGEHIATMINVSMILFLPYCRLQAQVALIEADACKAALKELNQEPIPPSGYNASQHTQPSAATSEEEGASNMGPGAANLSDAGVRLPSTSDEQLQRLLVEVSNHDCVLLSVSACTLILVWFFCVWRAE